MTWSNATAWADSLTVGGFTDWRLPTADPSCGAKGFNACTSSEMGHLFYDELGGTANTSILNSTDPDLGLFTFFNNGFGTYWTSTPIPTSPGAVFDYHFYAINNGSQSADNENLSLLAWAVRDGDVSVVSEPSIFALLGIGLLGFMRLNRNRQ